MKKILLVLSAVLLCALWACEDRDDNLSGPNIRVQNLSSLNFMKVEVRNDSLVYENIPSGGFSEYLEYELAYRQDTLLIETDSTSFDFQPDSISDPLPIGLYTYQINISESGEIELTFKVD